MGDTRIPVTVLTGFLGAGKTTLLNRLIAEPGFADTAVIVNEFGAVGVDAGLVETAAERAFAMTTGCLCCTVAGDVRLTLLRLAEEADTGRGPAFRRMVIETTGLADPAPVLHALMTSELVIERYALNGVATVVDAAAGMATLDRFAEARRQAAVADLLVLSKTDLAPDTAALVARLAAIAPNARRVAAAEAEPGDVFGLAAFDPGLKPPEVAAWLRFEPRGDGYGLGHGHRHPHAHDTDRHGDAVTAFCFAGGGALPTWDVQDALDALLALGADLLRLKGLVALDESPETPVVLHAVQHILHPPARLPGWPGGVVGNRLVVIAAGERRGEVPGIVTRILPALRPVSGYPSEHAAHAAP